MKKNIINTLLLVTSTFAAVASSQNYATTAYYKTNVGTPIENCLPHLTLKDCPPGLPTCIDFIPSLGRSEQLYDIAVPIPNTDRFQCEDPLEEEI